MVGGWVVVVVVDDVVVVLPGVHPIALHACAPAGMQIATLLVSNRVLIASPIEAGDEAATALKVTMATLMTPVGPARLLLWTALNLVEQLFAVEQVVWAVGVPWNSVVVPPEIEGRHVSAGGPVGHSASTMHGIVVVREQWPGIVTTVGS